MSIKVPYGTNCLSRLWFFGLADGNANVADRGSKFLKRWMSFLEENADLRYPNVADLTAE